MSDPIELLPYDTSARLYPDFLTSDAAHELFATLMSEVPWREWTISMFGKEILEPRLSAWIGDSDRAYKYSGRWRMPEPWTPTLLSIRDRCSELAGHSFNSVLANLYRTGRDSMGWHSDDERENGREPIIASLSLGAERRFDLRHKKTGETIKTPLLPGSLLVMSGRCQSHWMHQIPRTTKVDSGRINLTFRHVFIENELDDFA